VYAARIMTDAPSLQEASSPARVASCTAQLLKQVLHFTYWVHICLQDDDLRELRDTREWLDMISTVKGGMSREQKVNLRAEAKVRICCCTTMNWLRI
jgi:hypothetical protein